MRTALALVALTMLAGCSQGPGRVTGAAPSASTSATPTPTASPASDYELVRAAFRRTRAAGTARFAIEGSITSRGAAMTVRRTGAYDLPAGLMSVEQTFSSNPPGLFDRMSKGKVKASQMRARTVLAAGSMYLQMQTWPAPLNERWLEYTEEDASAALGTAYEVPTGVLPDLLGMLADAKPVAADGSGRGASPPVLHVAVPAKDAFVAMPTAYAVKLISQGYNPDLLAGSVDVEVTVERGLVTKVAFDGLDTYAEAMRDLGKKFDPTLIDAMPASIELSRHGAPPRIAVPPRARVVDQATFQRLFAP